MPYNRFSKTSHPPIVVLPRLSECIPYTRQADRQHPRAHTAAARRLSCLAMSVLLEDRATANQTYVDCLAGRRVVVTGGAGFIGSHLTDALATVAARVVVIDDMSTGDIHNLSSALRRPNVELVHDSILNRQTLYDTLKEGDIVFHLAALPSVTRSLQDPLATDSVNIHGTLSVLKAAADAGAAHVVFASSSSVYGDSPVLPRVETVAPQPLSPYAVSKLTGEHYCQVFARQFALQTTVVRFFNVYGPRQNPHSQHSAVIPRFVDAALDDRPLTICGDGQQTRDFTYIADVVQACLILAVRQPGRTFNVAAGNTISVNYLAECVLRATESSASIRYLPERPSDIRDSAAAIGKLQALDYKPQYSIEEGLEKTIGWMRTSRLQSPPPEGESQ